MATAVGATIAAGGGTSIAENLALNQGFSLASKIISNECSTIEEMVSDFTGELQRRKTIRVDREKCPKLEATFFDIIMRHHSDRFTSLKTRDAESFLAIEPTNGTYFVYDPEKLGDLYLTLSKKYLELSCYFSKTATAEDLIRYLKKSYTALYGGQRNLPSFIVDSQSKWHRLRPIAFSKQAMPHLVGNANVQDLLYYCQYRWETNTVECDHTCIILHGPPHGGKSTLVRHIATIWRMNIYQFKPNDEKLRDSDLAILFSQMQANSILVMDELDKQLDYMARNPKIKITPAEILASIDGVQPLAKNVFVFICTNDLEGLKKHFDTRALLRPGRFEKTVYIPAPSGMYSA